MRFSRFPHSLYFSLVFCLTLIFPVSAQIAGSPDTSFGTNGLSQNTLLGAAGFTDQIIQPDKKIVVLGSTWNPLIIVPPVVPAVARFNENGTLDTSFDTDGYNDTFNFSGGSKLALQADGKILIGGTSANHFAVFRLNANGSVDSSFGTNGLVTTVFGNSSQVNSVNVTADGKIVLAGIVTTADSDFGLIRYNSDGSLDTTFGTGGKVVTQLNGNEWANDSVIQADGKIVAVGKFSDPLSGQTKAVAIRYNTNGSLDTTFGTNGVFYKDNSEATKVALQNNGMLVIAGSGFVSRFRTNGALDVNVSTVIPNPNTIAVLADGKILVGGQTPTLLNAFQKFNRNGSLDTNFGTNGTIQTSYLIKKVSVAPDNKIVVGGQQLNISLRRYNNRLFNPINMFDFDGDTKADIAVYRLIPVLAGYWYGLNSTNNAYWELSMGNPGHQRAPADYDGDGKTDKWMYSNGVWYGYNSTTNAYQAQVNFWGVPSDTPMSADYDGDGRADHCLFRSSTGEWQCRNSTDNQIVSLFFGAAGDKSVLGDFDGDFKADIAVFRPSVGDWYWIRSSDGQFSGVHFGISTDKPVAADYDGDSKTDIAVYRDGIWYYLKSSDGSFVGAAFGTSSDLPVPADYDGDGKADLAVYRPSEGNWYLFNSTTGFSAVRFGSNDDLPISGAYIR
ncbi:MAG TPA: hypothetical protein PKY59_10330 [Pyrinomonadaceae bacterium]|nr:hypothetical protein [Pyrinomonadaceae bacterium]